LIDTVDGPRAVTLENGQYVPAERLSAALRASFRLFRFGDLMMLFFVALFFPYLLGLAAIFILAVEYFELVDLSSESSLATYIFVHYIKPRA